MKLTILFLSGFFTLFLPFITGAQIVILSGQILDEVSGQSLRYASVFEKEQGIGTISNNEGYYKLLLKPGEKTLKITSPGFQEFSESFSMVRDTMLTITLHPVKAEKAKTEEPVSIRHKKENPKEVSAQQMENKN